MNQKNIKVFYNEYGEPTAWDVDESMEDALEWQMLEEYELEDEE